MALWGCNIRTPLKKKMSACKHKLLDAQKILFYIRLMESHNQKLTEDTGHIPFNLDPETFKMVWTYVRSVYKKL